MIPREAPSYKELVIHANHSTLQLPHAERYIQGSTELRINGRGGDDHTVPVLAYAAPASCPLVGVFRWPQGGREVFCTLTYLDILVHWCIWFLLVPMLWGCCFFDLGAGNSDRVRLPHTQASPSSGRITFRCGGNSALCSVLNDS